MPEPIQFYSTEDWVFQVTAEQIDPDNPTSGATVPFDLSGYDLRCQFRVQPAGVVADDCSTANGDITRDDDDPSTVTITSLAQGRQFSTTLQVTMLADVMATKTVSGKLLTIAIGRLAFTVTPGVTYD